LLRFAHAPLKIADRAIFTLQLHRTKGPQQPANRGFYGFFNGKSHKTCKSNRPWGYVNTSSIAGQASPKDRRTFPALEHGNSVINPAHGE
jgi:hypothetical protein